MFNFGSHTTHKTCGAVIDIGSGSVGIAVVISDPEAKKPEIIWTHREYVPIKDASSTEIPLKEITTSLVNAFLQLGSQGSKALRSIDKSLHITSVDVTISAPWTYTVTKTINFTDEHPFVVDEELIQQLSENAQKQALNAALETDILEENHLVIINNKTLNTVINGYTIENPKEIKTRNVSLAHLTAITQETIISVLEDSRQKIVPKAEMHTYSFMYLFYEVLKHMQPDTSEACLVDITSEATEIGIIRQNTLTQVTHVPFGTFSIAREIAALCNIPKEEAYIYLKGGTTFVETKLSKEKLEELEVIVASYEDKVASLFEKTGDALAIPKTIFLHCQPETEVFFAKCIVKASKKATNMKHIVYPVTEKLFEDDTHTQTRILLLANYFHKSHIDKWSTDL